MLRLEVFRHRFGYMDMDMFGAVGCEWFHIDQIV